MCVYCHYLAVFTESSSSGFLSETNLLQVFSFLPFNDQQLHFVSMETRRASSAGPAAASSIRTGPGLGSPASVASYLPEPAAHSELVVLSIRSAGLSGSVWFLPARFSSKMVLSPQPRYSVRFCFICQKLFTFRTSQQCWTSLTQQLA